MGEKKRELGKTAIIKEIVIALETHRESFGKKSLENIRCSPDENGAHVELVVGKTEGCNHHFGIKISQKVVSMLVLPEDLSKWIDEVCGNFWDCVHSSEESVSLTDPERVSSSWATRRSIEDDKDDGIFLEYLGSGCLLGGSV